MNEVALILAPHGRDANLLQAMLAELAIASEIVPTLAELVTAIGTDRGFAILSEEALDLADCSPLSRCLAEQPEWSDFPFILLTLRGGVERNPAAERYLDLLGNVTFLERPFHPTTFSSQARAALRGRRKQYDARARMEALHDSGQRFRAAMEAVQGVLWTNTADGRMEGLQTGWAALTGQTYEQYHGYGWAHAVHPDDADPTIAAWTEAVTNCATFIFEHRVRRHDGVWRTFSIRAIPTFSSEGVLREWVGVHTDITGRRAAEAALRDLNATLERRVTEAVAERNVFADIFETTDSLVQVLDRNLCWLALNRAASDSLFRIYGRRPALGEALSEIMAAHPEQQAKVHAMWARALAGEEFTLVSTSLDMKTYESKFNVLRNAAGEMIGVYAISNDISQRIADAAQLAQTQEALRQSQKMEAIGQLTGGIAHDFNNLLTGILGGLDVVKRRIARGRLDELDRVMDMVSASAHRAVALVARLLAFSRRQSLDSRPVDVNALIASFHDLLRRTIGEHITLRIVPADTAPYALADANQLENAILNLVINARDAMPDGGELAITTTVVALDAAQVLAIPGLAPGEYVVTAVSDTGCGMAPDVLEKAFDPFFTTKAIGEGTGLGLSMVYGFARQSGGQAHVESTIGVGTTVRIYLPVAPAGDEQTEQSLPVASEGGGQIVLLVEDDEAVRTVMNEVLTEMSYRVLEAGDAASAIPILESATAIDLMISDVGLPGMNGRKLADVARQHRPELPILFVTGYAQEAAVRADFLGENMTMITKPFTLDALADKVHQMI